MNDDSHRSEIARQGKKTYRLKIVIAQVKLVPKQHPNYWDENESEDKLTHHNFDF